MYRVEFSVTVQKVVFREAFSCVLHENPEFSQRETAFSAVAVHREAVIMKALNNYNFLKIMIDNQSGKC